MRKPLGTKLYYTISEVATITELPPYTLRAWEKEFACLRPKRSRGKNRAYRDRDIGIILLIKRLLYDERYTSEGVKQRLLNEPELIRQATENRSSVTGAQGGSVADDAKPTAVGAPVGLSSAAEGTPDPAAAASSRSIQPSAELRALMRDLREELRILLDLL